MSRKSPALLAVAMVMAGCTAGEDPAPESEPEAPEAPVVVRPGAPGEPGETLPGGGTGAPVQPYLGIDVHFVQAMVHHHEQALEMSALAPARAAREEIRLLARRIEASQEAEIAQMEDWLAARGEESPDEAGDHGLMSGMATPAQLADLAAATGAAFDRLFLELMISHHEGAIAMVEYLRAAGGGHEPALDLLATHIVADQRIEISRMRALLE